MASRPSTVAVAAGGVVGAVAGAAGLAWAAQRAFVSAARGRDKRQQRDELAFVYDNVHEIPSHDGGVLRVYERGTGPTILFSHGVTLSARTWTRQFATLPEQGFRCVAFDHRGHGASIVGEHGHAVANLGADVASVVTGLDLRDIVLVGHSMGGVATMSFALDYPEVVRERVRGLVLLSTLARARSVGPPVVRDAVVSATRIGPGLGQLMSLSNFGYMLARLGFGRNPRPSHVDFVREMIAECPSETSHDATEALVDTDFTEELAAIDVPTLVMCGTSDVITPVSDSRRIVRRIPGARFQEFPGAGHMVMLEREEAFNTVLADFVQGVQRRVQHGRVHQARQAAVDASTARDRSSGSGPEGIARNFGK